MNRAPALTLWAAVVAEALGHAEDTALTLGSAVAGTAAQAKVGRPGTRRPSPGAGIGGGDPPGPGSAACGVRLLGREIAVTPAAGGLFAAAGADGRPQAAAAMRRYLDRAFGARLTEARDAMRRLAASLPPEDLDRRGLRLYDAFRPEVPEDGAGKGRLGRLHLDRIAAAGG